MSVLADPGSSSVRSGYRPDIDGLRALAVLLVLFDHLHIRFTGGYVGVDVFFVISGYLISSVILSGLQAGRFSIVEFYERRVRRIAPALLVMLLGASVLAYICDTPPELEDYARSLLASLFSVSNVLFWRQAGYFDGASAGKPLLHTWSLGVEEQFYIFFPLFLVAVRRWLPQHIKAAIWTVAGLSFAVACVYLLHDASGAYFLAPLRAWELMIGTIVSQRYVPAIEGSTKRNILAFAGLLSILLPALLFTSDTVFPGLAALPPCLGAALIIAAGETGPSLVARALSLRPVVFLGLISYSLYLWHWPVIVFQHSANLLRTRPGAHGQALLLTAVSIALGTLSWRFVERPFRTGSLRPRRRTLFGQTAAVAGAIAILGVVMIGSHGMASRFPPEARRVAQFLTYKEDLPYRQNVCFLVGPRSTFADFHAATCLEDASADASRHKQYLLIGDSHAAGLYPGLHEVFREAYFAQANAANCRPLLPSPQSHPASADCARLLDFLFREYLPKHRYDAVLLAARWKPENLKELGDTIEWLKTHGFTPVVFGPVIEYDAAMPRVLAISMRDGKPGEIAQHWAADTLALDQQLAERARTVWGIRYISMYEDLCQGGTSPGTPQCPLFADGGTPLLFDPDHLTAAGSVLYARAMLARNQLP